MDLVLRVIALSSMIGADINALRAANGNLSSLATTNKANLVAAINELYTLAQAPSGAQIDDAATNGATTVVWSADKVFDSIEAAKLAVKNELVDGAGAALDTLRELSAALGDNPNFATEIATALNNRVRYDAPQVLTVPQKKQACDNIGIGDPDTDFVAAYTTARNGV